MRIKIQKIILPLSVVFFFLFLIFLFFLRFTGQEAPFQSKIFPTPTLVQSPRKITVSGIKMNDFVNQPVEKNTKGDVLFVKTDKYEFVYVKEFNIFLITISAIPFEKNRKLAEEGFLKKLGITPKETCQLDVYLATPYHVDPQHSGIKYPLSFCENK